MNGLAQAQMPSERNGISHSPVVKMVSAALFSFGFDQLSKLLIIHWLDLQTVHTIAVWPPYLNFVMAWNPGVNFGILSAYNARWLLVAVSVAVSVGLAAWGRTKRGWLLPLATGAVIGGALGNALDRVIYGAVVDFLNMGCCGLRNPYSFNIADVLIVVGMLGIALRHQAAPNTDAAS